MAKKKRKTILELRRLVFNEAERWRGIDIIVHEQLKDAARDLFKAHVFANDWKKSTKRGKHGREEKKDLPLFIWS